MPADLPPSALPSVLSIRYHRAVLALASLFELNHHMAMRRGQRVGRHWNVSACEQGRLIAGFQGGWGGIDVCSPESVGLLTSEP